MTTPKPNERKLVEENGVTSVYLWRGDKWVLQKSSGVVDSFTPNNWWADPKPTNIQEALNRLATAFGKTGTKP